LKVPVCKQKNEAGQAAVLVVVAIGMFLFGAAGFAIDGSHLYAERQMAQAAADAAAQAGIRSIFTGSNISGSSAFSTGSSFTCTNSDSRTPCYYAQTLNGFTGTSDTVTVDFPSAATVGVPSGSLSTTDPVNLIRVTVARNVPTTFAKFISSFLPTVRASATAAIVDVMSPVPILVTHPTMSAAMQSNGNNTTTICGGADQSIQVNSSSSTAVSMNSNTTVDLSKAGPLDPGDCSAGTGANFGSFGGPHSAGWNLLLGSKGTYVQPSYPIDDPLKNVAAPSVASTVTPTKTALAYGSNGCPASAPKPCYLYSPGYYTSDIDVKNETAVFQPGIYYMYNSKFLVESNGNAYMSTGLTDPKTGTGWTGNMLVYMTGPTSGGVASTGYVSVTSNGTASLNGSPSGSSYKGILFFQDRTSAGHNTPNHTNPHALGGGGAITLLGTLYFNNTTMTSTQYQELDLQGNPGSSTYVQGEIIVSTLNYGGGANLNMNLNPAATLPVRQIALVQ
jgi:Putative Flp pilus-assembly TadE/G-like